MGSQVLQEVTRQDQDKINKNHSYELAGIVVHYGSGMHYGHYWSLARSKGNSTLKGSQNYKWIEFDDSKIRVVDDKET